MADRPQFGVIPAGKEPLSRPSSYCVVINCDGLVAVVRTRKGIYLPGGGCNRGEDVQAAALRELMEETGLTARIVRLIGEADEIVARPAGTFRRKESSFFLAEPGTQNGSGGDDHELIWMTPELAVASLTHKSHSWAVSRIMG